MFFKYLKLKKIRSLLRFCGALWVFGIYTARGQSVENPKSITIAPDRAFAVDFIHEGAGSSVILGFFYLDIDTDKDGLPDFFETGPSDDLDGDGLTNIMDPDDDNDGILDAMDKQPAGVTSMPVSFFKNGEVAAANGHSPGDYWQFVPNNTINVGEYYGYYEHPAAYLYIDNNSNEVPDILEYNTGANVLPPYILDKGNDTQHSILGNFKGLLGDWLYSGSPGSSDEEKTHKTGSTIFYSMDDDMGIGQSQSNLFPYSSNYLDKYSNTNQQPDYDLYGTINPDDIRIPRETIHSGPMGVEEWKYRCYQGLFPGNREAVFFVAVFFTRGSSKINTFYSTSAFNPDAASSSYTPSSRSTTGDNFAGTGQMNWFPGFQNATDHNIISQAEFGKDWDIIATSPVNGTSPIAFDPSNQGWVDKYENWTPSRKIFQYINVDDWLGEAAARDVLMQRYGYNIDIDGRGFIIRATNGKVPHFLITTPSSDPDALFIGIEDLYGISDRSFDDQFFYVTTIGRPALDATMEEEIVYSSCNTVKYSVTITNNGHRDASNVVFQTTLDPILNLTVGGVSTSHGTVASGNTIGDSEVRVNVGRLIKDGDRVKILFEASFDSGIFPGISQIQSFSTITGSNFDALNSYDPESDLVSNGTITELNIANANAIDLGPDQDLCPGSTIVLDALSAGKGDQLTFLWNDGSTAQTLTVNQTGTYSVTVTDENGCTATDDIIIIQDFIDPTVVTQDITILLDDNGNASITAA
ncbi:hypothetical protein E1171_12715, partial [Cytophagales bacterium RKSG123]|nr:hypothetical protein [Xanthovirga aplysinae]